MDGNDDGLFRKTVIHNVHSQHTSKAIIVLCDLTTTTFMFIKEWREL